MNVLINFFFTTQQMSSESISSSSKIAAGDNSSWFLYSCLEKVTKVLCIGRIHLGVAFVSEFSPEVFASVFSNLLLVRFHQSGIIILTLLIHERNIETWKRAKPLTLRS